VVLLLFKVGPQPPSAHVLSGNRTAKECGLLRIISVILLGPMIRVEKIMLSAH
jgi:hypothetical protein